MARLFGVIGKSSFDLSISIPSFTPTGRGMHGWGIAWYDHLGNPHIQKGKRSAVDQLKNQPITLALTSYLAISHLRSASSGTVSDTNAHPFQFQSWVFAHSGTVHKERIEGALKSPYNQNYQSQPIDSEIYFRYILQSMKEKGEIKGITFAVDTANDERGATFILTDGTTLYAYSYGIPLYYLKWRGLKAFSQKAESTGVSYQSNQLQSLHAFVVSSEKLGDDNWMVMDKGELLIVRKNLQYQTVRIL
jgi:glutamine amidotransferase